MRKIFCESIIQIASNSDFIFLTGDLGFNALEPLQKTAGPRFINAGIAEQNMISVAAGLARQGLNPWVYSIAPFLYARPLEQIRNDLCFHDLPVKLVGNGGGYAYGVMGASHHAIEDYGILLSLLNMNVFIPAFDSDIPPLVQKLVHFRHPAYLRLGQDEAPKDLKAPPYAAWRKILSGKGPTLLMMGPIAGGFSGPLGELAEGKRPNIWIVTELPFDEKSIPEDFLGDLKKSGHLMVVEEHVAHGGGGEMLARCLLLMGRPPARFSHYCARGYLSGYYGSQAFHRKECGLVVENLLKELE